MLIDENAPQAKRGMPLSLFMIRIESVMTPVSSGALWQVAAGPNTRPLRNQNPAPTGK
jgi:hypothetical protein